LSEKLGFNIARWKRWSREFLPPDPLAGQQAGYARQYYVDNAFTVFVGGHLVAELGFAIPEARLILSELKTWMKSRGFQFDPRGKRQKRSGIDAHVKSYAIHIRASRDRQFKIYARGTIGRSDADYEGFPVNKEVFVDQPITSINDAAQQAASQANEKVLLISELLDHFSKALDPQGIYFSGLVEGGDDRLKIEG
jgi:hypothetical protein